MRKSVEDAERAFLAFKEGENLFSIEGKQKINVQKIEDMNASYIEARSKRLVVEAKIHELKKFINGSSEQEIWATRYFLPAWQDFFDLFNSIPMIAVGMIVAWNLRRMDYNAGKL